MPGSGTGCADSAVGGNSTVRHAGRRGRAEIYIRTVGSLKKRLMRKFGALTVFPAENQPIFFGYPFYITLGGIVWENISRPYRPNTGHIHRLLRCIKCCKTIIEVKHKLLGNLVIWIIICIIPGTGKFIENSKMNPMTSSSKSIRERNRDSTIIP